MPNDKTITINNPNRANKESDYPSSSRDHDGRGDSSWADETSKKESGYGTGNKEHSGGYSNIEGAEKHNQLMFENSLDKTGVLNMQYASSNILNQMTNLINIRGTMENGWGPNVLMNLKVLNLSGSSLSGPELSPLFKSMYYQKMDLNLLDLSYNKMCDNSVGKMLWSIGNEEGKQVHAIKALKINNNQFGDQSAEYFNWHLSSGSLKYTKHIDISGNKITQTGDTKIVQALNNPKTPDVVVLTQELKDSIKMITGTKEEKIAIFKDLLRQGVEKGTNDKAIVADGSMKNKMQLGVKQLFGFSKCHWNPEEIVQGYAEDKIFAKLPKALGKFLGNTLNIQSIVSCYLESSNEAWTSETGQAVLKDQLCVMGESEFCGDQ